MDYSQNSNLVRRARYDFLVDCKMVYKRRSLSDFKPISSKTSGKLLILAKQPPNGSDFSHLDAFSDFFIRNQISFDVVFEEGTKARLASWQASKLPKNELGFNVSILVDDEAILASPVADVLGKSFQLERWLNRSAVSYDTVLCLDNPIITYYPQLSKKMGLAYSSTDFVHYLGSSGYYECVRTGTPITSLEHVNKFYIEQQVFSGAEAVISHGEQFLNWLAQQLGENKDNLYYQCAPSSKPLNIEPSKLSKSNKESQIVFLFGRQNHVELQLCLEALARLDEDFHQATIFLPEDSDGNLRRQLKIAQKERFRNLSVNYCSQSIQDMESDLTKALLVVVPCAEGIEGTLISWIQQSGIELLMNDSHGLRYKDREVRSFVHNPERIKAYIFEAINSVREVSSQVYDGDRFENQSSWMVCANEKASRARPEDQLVVDLIEISVCIAHYNRGEMLLDAIESIRKQTYPCLEIIVVDDGSTDLESLEVLERLESSNSNQTVPIKVIRQKNLFLGASRNRGLEAAQGAYILFMDDDNLADVSELEIFATCARSSGADILTCFSQVFSGRSLDRSKMTLQTALYVGPNLSSGLFANHFGDSNMFVKVSSAKAIGGFSEYFKTGRDDQEFFVRAISAGLDLSLVPRPLYYYRLNFVRMRASHMNPYGGLARVLKGYSSINNGKDDLMLRYAQGLSYASGPWGLSLRAAVRRLKMIEYFRIYVARYPMIYRIFVKLKGLF